MTVRLVFRATTVVSSPFAGRSTANAVNSAAMTKALIKRNI